MAKRNRNALEILHAAVTDPVARSVLGALSPGDLEILAEHASNDTLLKALLPLVEHDDLDNAIAAMPNDIAEAARSLPDHALAGIKVNLSALAATGGGTECKCR